MEYKDYKIVGDGTFGNLHIKGEGKGALPMVLRGSFTNYVNAKRAIDSYRKAVNNGKGKSTS